MTEPAAPAQSHGGVLDASSPAPQRRLLMKAALIGTGQIAQQHLSACLVPRGCFGGRLRPVGCFG